MLDKIRQFIQSIVFKTKLKQHQREKQISSLNSAKTVGVDTAGQVINHSADHHHH